MRTVRRAIHIDFHTMPGIHDIARRFDVDAFVHTLKAAHVDFVNVFAKCNIGFAYYPTQVGVTYPGLEIDLLGQMVRACRKHDIGVVAYFNIGLDHEGTLRHPEWCTVNREGQVIHGDRTSNAFRTVSLCTGYYDHMLKMIGEVVPKYPVDGVFLDCLPFGGPDYGSDARRLMIHQGLDENDDQQVRDFYHQRIVSFCRDVRKLIGPEMTQLSNGLPYRERMEFDSHIEIEWLPSAWGYEHFSMYAAYARNLNTQVIYMTGRFHRSWGDFGGLKSQASLEYDLWDAMSHGMAISIGDHMHPRDGLEPATYQAVQKLFDQHKAYEPWIDGAKAVAQVAVIVPPDSRVGQGSTPGQEALTAAARMLGELKYTFDILEPTADLSPYPVVVLPDLVTVTPELAKSLQAHLDRGGGIISTGWSGLNPEKTAFALLAWEMDTYGDDPLNIVYFTFEGEDVHGHFPRRDCAIYKPGIALQVKQPSQTVASYVQPYFNKHWDGFHGYFYTPPEKPTGRPAVARSGRIFQFAFALFTGYGQTAMPEHRHLLQHALEALLPEPILRHEGLPVTARMALTATPEHALIHVRVTYPELRGRYNIIEEHNTVHDAVVLLKADKAPQAVQLAPSGQALDWTFDQGYIRITLPPVTGYALVAVTPQKTPQKQDGK